IVVSSAVKSDNPEVVAARARRLPVVRRAEMLGELMRLKWSIAIAGTHGKTTTTSMIGALLETAGLDPTVINGGIINAYGTNTRPGPDGSHYDAVIADRLSGQERVLAGLFLPMFGEHNVQNSLTVLAVAEEMGLGDEVVRASLREFKGVHRRFTKTGEWNGVTIIDDYGHPPADIAAVLKAARAIVAGRV